VRYSVWSADVSYQDTGAAFENCGVSQSLREPRLSLFIVTLQASAGQTTGQDHIYRFTAESAEFAEEGDNERGRFTNRPLLFKVINDFEKTID